MANENAPKSDIVDQTTSASTYRNPNGFPYLPCGSTLHLACKPGEIANRIISVGSGSRAKKVAAHFDFPEKVHEITSARGFTIYTGTVRNVAISVIATGMGIANMDFVVREARAVVEGPMAIVRFGTCGGLQEHIGEGSVCVATPGSVLITRNPDAFHPDGSVDTEEEVYNISKRPVPAHERLSQTVVQGLKSSFGESHKVHEALNVTACSFYSSQGRLDPNFLDLNHDLHGNLLAKYSAVGTMEMESFHLLDLARCSKGSIIATAAVIVVANRPLGTVVDGDTISHLESHGGKAILHGLSEFLF